jgi:glucokinase
VEVGVTFSLGVDIGGTKIAAGVVDESGEIVVQNRRATPVHNAEAVVEAIVDMTKDFSDYSLESIGIGVAGLVDADRSHVLLGPNLGWENVPLRQLVERGTRLPTVVENDANAAAWGEFQFGAGRDFRSMVTVTVGTGIGGGVVLDDRLQRGAHGVAAEFGHLRVVPQGRLCGCGRYGCWEQYASGNALVRTARELAAQRREEALQLLTLGDGTPEGVQGRHVTEAARLGDVVAINAFDTVGRWLAHGMVEVAALLDPGVFIIGGGVIEAGDLLLAPTRELFERDLVGKDVRTMTPVLPAELGNLAGLSGAADLARQR